MATISESSHSSNPKKKSFNPQRGKAINDLFEELNVPFKPNGSISRQGSLLYQKLCEFHQDPNHPERLDLSHNQNAAHVDSVLHKFLRIHGKDLFGEPAQQRENSDMPVYEDDMDVNE